MYYEETYLCNSHSDELAWKYEEELTYGEETAEN